MNKNNFAKLFTVLKLTALAVPLASLMACGGGSTDNPDPTVNEKPIAYVKRPTPVDANNAVISNDLRDPIAFRPGAHLIVKRVSTLSSPEIDITAAIIGDTGDVRDPEFDHTGTKLVFSLMKEDDNMDPPETWDIYEYDFNLPLSQVAGSENPRRVMNPTNDDQGHDIAPAYLPGNRIVFSSTRAQTTGSVLLAEGKSAYSPTIEATNSDVLALNLHTMQTDGTQIKQITFNMSHDLDPTVLRNLPGYAGYIVFTRWENSVGRNQMSLYRIKPDGSDVTLLYGAHSHATGTSNSNIEFASPRETLDGDILIQAREGTGTFDGGDLHLINVNDYIDNTVPKDALSGLTGPAQGSVSSGAVDTRANQFSLGGRFNSAVPLLDGSNRALASYSFCFADVTDPVAMTTETFLCNDSRVNLADPNTTIGAPRYGVYVLDLGANTILPVTIPLDGFYFTDVALAQDLGPLTFIDDTFSTGADPIGTIHIRSVYETDGVFNPMGTTATSLDQLADPMQYTADTTNNPTLAERPAVFLRIVKGVSLPDNNTRDFNNNAFGIDNNGQLMREIIGYVPIDPDGSVRFNAPANVPLSFSILDKDGRRVNGTSRHNNWITLRPGEEITCHGCHNHASGAPHGRAEAARPVLNQGWTSAASWPNTIANTLLLNMNDTMAFARTEAQGLMKPSVDISYDDYWTSPMARTPDTAFSYSYSTVATALPLNFGACANNWNENCRVIINYPANIQPLWERDRYDSAMTNHRCVDCHTNLGGTQVPMGTYQIDLTQDGTGDPSGNAFFYKSFEELVGGDNRQVLMGTTVVEDDDGMGNPIPIGRVLIPGQANNAVSDRFFTVFTRAYYDANVANPAAMPHWDPGANMGAGDAWLSTGELKLISEWDDIGAQYYNNPFSAPVN